MKINSRYLDLDRNVEISCKYKWDGNDLPIENLLDVLLDKVKNNDDKKLQAMMGTIIVPFLQQMHEKGILTEEEFSTIIEPITTRFTLVWIAMLGYLLKECEHLGMEVEVIEMPLILEQKGTINDE